MVAPWLTTLACAALLVACGWDLPAPRVDAGNASDAMAATDVSESDGGACPAGQITCAGACVDPLRDPRHCGECAVDCGAAVHAIGACTEGRCSYQCESGFENCDGNVRASGCALVSGAGCASCDQASPDACNSAAGYACHLVTRAGADVQQCCRAVAACGPGNCGPTGTCVHSTDFDLCCAMGM